LPPTPSLAAVSVGAGGNALFGGIQPDFARLTAEGKIDTGFRLPPPYLKTTYSFDSVVVQPNRMILIAGELELRPNNYRSVARFFPDGTRDTNFANFPERSEWSGNLDVLSLKPDGTVLAAGTFILANGITRNRIAQLRGDGPEAELPSIIEPPVRQFVRLGAATSLTVQALGAAPLSYLWRRGDTYLPNQTNATINLPSFQASDAGDYSVLVFNHAGVAESQITRVMLDESPEIRLSLVRRKPDEPPAFELRLSGSAIPDLLIEASSDLRLWKPISTNATGLDLFNIDTRTAGYSEPMFIRARTK
jgi:hypothetical protein